VWRRKISFHRLFNINKSVEQNLHLTIVIYLIKLAQRKTNNHQMQQLNSIFLMQINMEIRSEKKQMDYSNTSSAHA
jgi:hypothetical protein